MKKTWSVPCYLLAFLLVAACVSPVAVAANLALGKATTQSSTGWGGLSSRAVDGNTNGAWSDNSYTHTQASAGNDWWEVDLGSHYLLSEIKVFNTTSNADRLNNSDILVSSSPFPARPLNAAEIAEAKKGTIGTAQAINTFTPNAVGRYIRVQLQGWNFLHMAEVEAYGTAVAPPPPTDPLLVDDDKAQCPTAGKTTIAAAVAAASAGDTITVCPGTYNEYVNVDKAGLTIKGSTGNAADVTVRRSGNWETPFGLNAANITLKNMTLVATNGGVGAAGSSPGPLAFENLIVSADKYGLFLYGNGAGAVTFKNVAVTATTDWAIYMGGLTGAHTLEGVTAIGGQVGIYAPKGLAKLTNVNAEGKSGTAIGMGNTQAATFSNVTAISSGGYDHGIFISASDTTNHPYTFTKVTASGKNRGINIGRSGKVTMTDVTATGTGESGIYLDWNADGAHVFENITATGGGGITLQRGAASFKNVTATGTSGSAIWMGNKYAATLDTVTANAPNHRGIEIANVDTTNYAYTFTNVKVTSKSRGINVARSGKVTMDKITVNTPDVGIFLDAEAKGGHELTNLDLTAGNGAIIADGAARIEDFKTTTGIFLGTAQDVVIRRGLISSPIGMGIQINGADKKKVTVEDVTISTGWQYGFMLMKSSEALIQRVCVSGMSTTGIHLDWDARNVTLRDSQFGNSGSFGGVYVGSNPDKEATITNNAFLKATTPRASSNSKKHKFDGNYWQGVAGGSNYTDGNIRDESTLSSNPVAGCYGPPATLSAHYKFDDASGWSSSDPLDDSSGNGKNATLSGTVTQESASASGVKPDTCKAGNFNKAGYFTTPSGLDIDTATGGKNSVSFWMYWDGGFSSSNFTMPFSWGGVYYDLTVSKYRESMGNGVIGFNTGNGDVFGVTASGLANGWHHVAAVFNNGDVTQSKLYIDGVQKTLTSYGSQSTRSATTSAGIGAGAGWGGDYKWSGKLDNLKIYKGAISPAQVTADYTASAPCAGALTCTSNLIDSATFGSDWYTRVVSGSFTPKLVDGSGNSCSGSSCRLRLTDTGTNEATQVSYIKQGFPFGTNKVTAEFDYWSYGGSKADGIAIVFSDPNDPAGNNPPTAGGFGGSLGYANRDGVNGFTGGWIGLGLDEYGNYANPTEGRNGGTGFQKSSVAIRGAMPNYAFLAGNNSWSKTADGDKDSDKNYRYRITLDGTGGGGNSAVVTVERDTSGTGNSYQTQLTYTTGAPPAQLQFSTTGSTGASTNNHEIANLKICYQTSSDLPPPSTGAKPANFNCVESGASASTGHLYTKLAGTAFSFDVVALKADGSVETAYAADADKPVKVELVDGSGTTACASRTAINPAVSQTLTFTKAASGTEKGRKATANMTVSNANKDVLCRVTDANQTPSIVGCSIDHFAVRPSAVTLGVSPTMATPPLASAANPIKAGAAFTVNATTSPAAGYSGSLSLDTSKLSAQTTTQGTTIQSGGVVGTLSPPTLAANPATSPSNNASYTEVGYLYLAPGAYRDDSYTGVDQPSGCAATNSCDCVTDTTNDANLSDALASGKYGCSIGNTANYSFGRFTPDHFDVSVAANGAMQKVCSNSFTYTGQAMSYATAPSLTIKAMNALATPTVTQNYAGVFQKLAASGVAITAPTADGTQKGKDGATKTVISPSMSAGTLANSSGTLTYTLASGDQYTYTRDANALVGAYTSDIPLVVASVSDGEVSAAGTLPTLKPTGVSLRFGRLKISNAYGSDKSDLQVPVQAQYWSGLTWVKNADDSCTPIAKAAVKLTGALSANNAVSAGVTLSNGAASIVLKCPYATCPPASKPDTPLVGSVGVCVDIGADPASGVACSATSAAMPWLQGKWPPGSNHDNDPTARATFGVYSAETKKSVHVRELY